MKKIAFGIHLNNLFLFLIAQPTNIISTKKQYQFAVDSNLQKQLININKTIPTIILDLRYGTINNFTKTKLYKKVYTTYMRVAPANALLQVQNYLANKGLGVKIFDAYRPYTATKLMWKLINDDRYVANPKNGSNHNRGLAIDLTIVNLKTLQELDMGTGFDNFTDTAHHSFIQLPDTILANRKLLKTTMELFGFTAFDTEWWHYTWPNNLNYEVMDISFGKLNKMVK
jgi:zinc D-Ala-D-Ala dipeptidase